jgi:hypothetical protein
MKNSLRISFFVFINFKTWFVYTRRPHFAELHNFGELNIIQNPMVIISGEFLKNIFQSIYFYFKYSRKIKKDERCEANLIRPILIFPVSFKNKYPLLNRIDYFLLNFQIKKLSQTAKDNVQVYILNQMKVYNDEYLLRSEENISFRLHCTYL